MNSVVLIGRLTRDPEVRYTAGTQMAVCTFTVAIDRPVRAGGEKQTDFPRVTVFGKQAENCERFLAKGRLVGVQGRLQTGSYTNKDGATVYKSCSYQRSVCMENICKCLSKCFTACVIVTVTCFPSEVHFTDSVLLESLQNLVLVVCHNIVKSVKLAAHFFFSFCNQFQNSFIYIKFFF